MANYFVPVTVPCRGKRQCYPSNFFAPTELYYRPSVLSDMTLDLLPFLLSDLPAFSNGLRRCEKEKKPVVKPWTKFLKVKGYDPDDIKVMIENGKVIVHCRHEEKDGENFDLIESRRSVELPQNVDPSSVKTFMIDQDSLLIQAQLQKCAKETTEKAQTAKETKSVPEDRTERKLPIVLEHSKHENKEQESPKEEACILRVEKPVDCMHNGEKEAVETCRKDTRDIKHDREEGGYVTTPIVQDNRGKENSCKCDWPAYQTRPESPCECNGNVCYELNWGAIPLSYADNDTDCTFSKDDDKDDSSSADKSEIVEKDGKNIFLISVGLKDYDPDTISIRFMGDQLEVTAKRESCDKGFTSSDAIFRRYTVPEGTDIGFAKATMNDNGILKICVPFNQQ